MVGHDHSRCAGVDAIHGGVTAEYSLDQYRQATQAMKPVDQKPILFTDGLVDVTYFCERCHTKTIRTLKPGDAIETGNN